MRKRIRQIVVYPYTDQKMEEKIRNIMRRLSGLQQELTKSSSDYNMKELVRLIKINEIVLHLLVNQLPVRFYKREESDFLEPLKFSD